MSEKRYRKQADVKIDGKDKEILVKIAQKTKMTQKIIVGHLIGLCDKYNLMKPGWEDRLNEAERVRRTYTRLEGSCSAMTFADEHFICVWGNDGAPPTIKKLAKDMDHALDVCANCRVTLEIKLENVSLQDQIRVLENKLQTKRTEKYKIPVCQQGATLSEDCLNFNGCPKNQGKPVSVKEYCQKLRSGQGCAVYVERVLGVGEKI